MAKANLTLKRGDTGQWEIACTAKTGGPLNLTGAVLRFYAKASALDADSAAVLKKDSAGLGGIVIMDAGNGVARLILNPADTVGLTSVPVALAYDIQVTESNGAVTTLLEGNLTIGADITQAY